MGKKLIIFEGMDGTGKTTQMELVFNELSNRGIPVIRTREPGGTPAGEEIRKLLKSKTPMSNDTVAYLFAAARMEHNLQIKKWIKEGYIVLCDRHFLSSYVYQGVELAEEINHHAMQALNDIDFHIVGLFVNPLSSNDRIGNRNEATDRFEEKLKNHDTFIEHGRKYLELVKHYKGSIIDTNYKSIEKIHEEIMEELNIII